MLHQPARVHHRQAIGEPGDHAQIVGDDQDGHPELFPEPREQRQDLRLDGDVEGRRRLIGDQEAGSQLSAIAIIARCRMPPLNWWG